MFNQFEHTAWRVETRRRYATDEVTDTYAQFTRGEPVDWAGKDAEWCAERREQAALGKRFERLRIVDNPPTRGHLYLLGNARRNSAGGDDIRQFWRVDTDRRRDRRDVALGTVDRGRAQREHLPPYLAHAAESAVYGADAHRIISAARQALNVA